MYNLPNKPTNLYSSDYAPVRNIVMHNYKPQLNIIAAFLFVIILIGVNNMDNKTNNTSTVSNVASIIPAANYYQPITDTEVESFVEYQEYSDYQLHIQDEDKFILKDGDAIIHVFDRKLHPNCDVFKVIDRDNE